ncbi:MAG: archease [Gemmatimonadota bacterium]
MWPDGVTGLDHTADVGIAVRAPTLEELFRRAAAGMVALVGGVEGAANSESHAVELAAPDREALLVAWLREVLFLFQTRAFQYVDAHFDVLSDTRLVARLDGTAAEPVMELKGVTYHALAVRREDDGWLARVVFDV